jgi:hypothetical protein
MPAAPSSGSAGGRDGARAGRGAAAAAPPAHASGDQPAERSWLCQTSSDAAAQMSCSALNAK